MRYLEALENGFKVFEVLFFVYLRIDEINITQHLVDEPLERVA